jgi:hypothetical protein
VEAASQAELAFEGFEGDALGSDLDDLLSDLAEDVGGAQGGEQIEDLALKGLEGAV